MRKSPTETASFSSGLKFPSSEKECLQNLARKAGIVPLTYCHSELGAVRTGHCQNRALSELHEYCRNYMGTVGTGHCRNYMGTVGTTRVL